MKSINVENFEVMTSAKVEVFKHIRSYIEACKSDIDYYAKEISEENEKAEEDRNTWTIENAKDRIAKSGAELDIWNALLEVVMK